MKQEQRQRAIAAAMAAAGLLCSGLALAESAAEAAGEEPTHTAPSTPPEQSAVEKERVLAPMNVSAQHDKPVEQRTELGKLTEHTPMAGTVVSREEVAAVHFVDSLNELLPRVPGISMSRNLRFTDGGKNYTENRIDGMRARNTGTYTFIDEVNSGDIERIEIIRGPGSVLSGSNAIGGTLNVITRDPPSASEHEATAEAFGDGGYRAGMTAGAPMSESAAYFISANRLDREGWRDHSEQAKDSLSTKWLFRPDASSRLNLRLEYVHDNFQDPGNLSEEEFEQNWRQAEPDTYYHTDITYITPSLHYRNLIGEAGEVNIAAQHRLTKSSANAPAFSTASSGGVKDAKTTEDNLQLMYKHQFSLAKSTVTAGIDVLGTESRSKNYTGAGAATFSFERGELTGDSISRETHRSPFLQYEVSPFDLLRLTFGLRQDNLEYKIDDQMKDYKDGTKKYDRLVKKFGAVYELDPNNLLWLNIAEGFMGPGVSTLLGSGTPTPDTHAAAVRSRYIPANDDLKPEDSLTKEIGIRGLLPLGLRYDTAYYRTDFKNLIVSTLCGDTELCYTKNENAASAHASGVETSLEYSVGDYLDLGLAHTYAKYRYENYVSGTSNYSGKDRYYTPRNHINLRVAIKPSPDWRSELEIDHIDSYYTNQATTDSYKRPDLYHLRTSYSAKNWSAWLHILNLLDTKYAYRVGSTDAGVRITYTAGYMPLTVRLGVSYKF